MEEKKEDILSNIKKIEKINKAKKLGEAISILREKTKQILVLKRETVSILKEIGLCESDRKKVIDYINSTTKITSLDKSKVKETTQKAIRKIDDKVMNDKVESSCLYSYSIPTYNSGTANYTCAGNSNELSVTLGDKTLKM